MDTTVRPHDIDPRGDEAVIPLVPEDDKGPRDALAKLAEEAARATARLRPAATANFSAGPRVTAPVVEPAPTLRADDTLLSEPAPRPRRAGQSPVRFILAVGLGVGVTLAWQSYGQAARQVIAAYVPALAGPSAPAVVLLSTGAGREPDPAVVEADAHAAPVQIQAPAAAAPAMPSVPAVASPSPELAQQIETMARDLAALRDGMAKVNAAQDQMSRSIAKLQDADEEPRRTAVPSPRPAPARKPVAVAPRPPMPPPVAQAAPRPAAAQAVTSTPLPPLTSPAASALPEPPRRPPASMP